MPNKTITSAILTASSLCFSQGLPTIQKLLIDQELTQNNIESHALAIELSEILIDQIGKESNFGGIWYTRDAHGNTVMHIGQKKFIRKNSALENITKNTTNSQITIAIEDVDYSIRELEEYNKRIYQIIIENEEILTSGINSAKNKISITTKSKFALNIKNQLSHHSIPESAYYIEEIPN